MIIALIVLYLLGAAQSYWLAGQTAGASVIWPLTTVFVALFVATQWFFDGR